ncbi:winged helix-turn-helix domain-containing protein [Amorphoplanes nipponensis]|uniref:Transcriptional regulator n=1 Tax=Actinoplanes nipponensis TaxID=135950 RepID=A0A919JQ88_9ACTN|nr:winged helix-turn-helix domain-containing protein [Actinoplanes nipponensis]GIE53492.1 transcriptional regulator [Actinoplanes nipponensis]
MLRIHFTTDDVARVRVAAEPDPLWETVISVFRLRRPGPDLVFGRWHRHALRASRRSDVSMLARLVHQTYFPDFLTPAEGAASLSSALDAVMATPVSRLRTDMARLARTGTPMTPWMRQLAEGDPGTLRQLAGALRSHHDSVVAPFGKDAQAQVDADRGRRARVLLDQGAEGLLNSFRPMMRWERPVLEVDVPQHRTLHLNGRGLLLVPSYLSFGTPDVLFDPELPPVLVYPIEHCLSRSLATGTALSALIGPTRAAVLESLADGRTTSELARRVGVSRASVSQHTAVLRDAGLLHTVRAGKAVLHSITPLGTSLLSGDPR